MLIHRRNNRHHGDGRRTSVGIVGAVIAAMLAIVVGVPAWVGPTVGADDHACDDAIVTYRLAAPGTYSAFTRSSQGSADLEVWAPSGELLVASPSEAMTAAVFDLATAMRYGVPAPPVFEVDSHVDLRVESTHAPYELVLVRFGDSDEWSGLEVHPPLVVDADAAELCGSDRVSRPRSLRIDAVYSDAVARQVFVISSDERVDFQPVGPVRGL